MGKSDQVYELIQSLSQSEKRHFKLHAVPQAGEDSLYVELFDLMAKQKAYDLTELQKQLGQKVSMKHLAVVKTQLKEHILKSLRTYHHRKNQQIQIREQLDFTDILISKNQLELAYKCLSKAKKKAYTYQLIEMIDEVNSKERSITRMTQDNTKMADFLANTEASFQNLRALEITRKLEEIEVKVLYFFKHVCLYIRTDQDLKRINALVDEPVLQMDERDIPKTCQSMYHQIWSYYYLATRNYPKVQYHLKNSMEFIRSSPYFLEQNVFNYLNWMRWTLSAATNFEDDSDFNTYYTEAIAAIESNTPHKISPKMRAVQLHYLDVIYYCFLVAKHRNEEALQKLKAINHEQRTNLHLSATVAYPLKLLYVSTFMYIQLRDFKSALKTINQTLTLPHLKTQDYAHVAAEYANIMIHYELGNHSLIKSLIKSLERLLVKYNLSLRFEKAALAFARKVLSSSEKDQHLPHFIAFRTELNAIYQDSFEHIVDSYFPILSWVNDVIERYTTLPASSKQ